MKLKLEDVCEKGSSSLKQSDICGKTGDYPIYGASGYIGNVDFYHQEKPYVAVVKDGAGIGRTTFHPAKSSVIGTMQYLLPKDNLLPKYLYYVVGHMHLEKYFSGATIPHIYFKDYKSEEFNYDSLDKQKNIVEILGRCEKVISARKSELELLDRLIKARFVEMFENENHEIVKAYEICDFITKGTTPPTGEIAEEYNDRKIPFLKVYNLSFTGEMLFDENPQYIPRETHDGKLTRSKVYPNDVLMNIVGPPLGKFALVTNEFNEWNINQAIAIFRAKDRILPRFLLHALMQPKVLEPFIGQAVGIRQQNLSLEQCRNLQIILPSLKEQQSFVEFAEQVDKSKLLSLIKRLEQLTNYLYNVFIIYRQDKGEEVERYE